MSVNRRMPYDSDSTFYSEGARFLPYGPVNCPERPTQADLFAVTSLHLEQERVVIGVEHDVSGE